MHVVPVIDVRFGVAVRAVGGDRQNYAPLVTPFAGGSEPVEVARGLIEAFGFTTLYVADLDGIEGRGRNAVLAEQLMAAMPDVDLWLDNGTGREGLRRDDLSQRVPSPSCRRQASSLTRGGLGWGEPQQPSAKDMLVPVVGSESLQDVDEYARQRGRGPGLRRDDVSGEHVLSLDFRGDEFIGPTELLASPELWPARVIVMTLARVGGAAGPDLDRIADIAMRAGARSIYAAGGMRTIDDLRAAREAGASGALIATALHAGTVKPADIRDAAGP